jgi:hypothetical protein
MPYKTTNVEATQKLMGALKIFSKMEQKVRHLVRDKVVDVTS